MDKELLQLPSDTIVGKKTTKQQTHTTTIGSNFLQLYIYNYYFLLDILVKSIKWNIHFMDMNHE